jgi:N-acetylglucosaminyl-diphospho-decaprenol L-rhamnosyltransferase
MSNQKSSPVEVAVIIVNYNTADLTIDCLESVIRHGSPHRRVSLHVVDNGSPLGDGSIISNALAARGWSSRVTLLCEATNHGFGRGVNLVITQFVAPLPQYVFLLNPDARLENDAVSILANFLDEHPHVSAAGAKISSPAGIPVTGAFRFPSVIWTFASALCFGPLSRLLRSWEVPLSPDIPTQPVDWVTGAAVMMRLSDVQRAGFFDPAYFLYFEEVDLMRELKRQGGEIWHVAEANVVHIEGAATGVKSGRERPRRLPPYWYQSWARYFFKNHGRSGALLAATAWYVGAAANTVLARLRGQAPQAPSNFYSDFWRIAVRPLLGLEDLPNDR